MADTDDKRPGTGETGTGASEKPGHDKDGARVPGTLGKDAPKGREVEPANVAPSVVESPEEEKARRKLEREEEFRQCSEAVENRFAGSVRNTRTGSAILRADDGLDPDQVHPGEFWTCDPPVGRF